jgi:hypothetical protein
MHERKLVASTREDEWSKFILCLSSIFLWVDNASVNLLTLATALEAADTLSFKRDGAGVGAGSGGGEVLASCDGDVVSRRGRPAPSPVFLVAVKQGR